MDMVIFTNIFQHIQNGINLCSTLSEIACPKGSGAACKILPNFIQPLMMQQGGKQR